MVKGKAGVQARQVLEQVSWLLDLYQPIILIHVLYVATPSRTQSTFATGGFTRLTNAAEEPFRRPGFYGQWETLSERNMRSEWVFPC